ncbi:MAG: hypothetical protein NZT92_06335 [Abditibacteriales bacterium]|nr:hypothetical protein [Abditibacteriales bacterium]MDW8365551.1 hypothetical protein [Abditibacteriales bacterium]
MKMSRKEFHGFQTAWQEYELMLTRILPKFIKRGLYDLSDDLDHALFCRSEIEGDFARYPNDPKLLPYRMKVVALDGDLLLMRKEVLARLSPQYLRSYRQRNAIPRTHWWWYLDEAAETKGARKRATGAKQAR